MDAADRRQADVAGRRRGDVAGRRQVAAADRQQQQPVVVRQWGGVAPQC